MSRLEKIDERVIVHETGRQKNEVEYDSEKDLSNYSRRKLSFTEKFLRVQGELEEADKIKKYLGKIIRAEQIPELIPTGSYQINSSLDYLKDTINTFVEQDGLNLDPDFQRGHIWSMNQRIAYIEFILQGGKSNPIYLNHENWMGSYKGEFVIVDGKQRLTSLLMFLNNQFPVFKNLDTYDGTGFYAKEFNLFGRDVIIVVNDLKTRKQVLQWYLQMNKGNIAHTEEDLSRVERLLELEGGE